MFDLRFYYLIPFALLLLINLPGCTQQPSKVEGSQTTLAQKPLLTPTPSASPDKPVQAHHENKKLERCSQELLALKTFNSTRYTAYHRELERLTFTGKQYLAISEGIGSDINDIVLPRYQYALTSLCHRISNDLTTALIHQVNTNE